MIYQLTSEIAEEGIARITEYDENCNSIIESWDIDLDLKRALQWYWFKDDFGIFYSIQSVIDEENEMNNISNNLLTIGRGPNGDDLLVNTKTLEVVFWNHECAENHEIRKASDCVKLYNHLHSLFLNIRNRNYIPWDSFAAKDYYEIRRGI